MQLRLTRKRIVNALLIGTLALGLGGFNSQPAAAQLNRDTFREIASELDLSRSQMREIGSIMRGFNAEIEEILTPEQLEQLQATREQQPSQEQDPQELHEALNLTDTQATQLSTAREEMVVELQAILTPDQLERIIEMTTFSQL